MEGLTVGEVARTSGVTVRTLQYWDAVGLLVPSGRTTAGYRVYAPADVDRLARVLAHRRVQADAPQADQAAEPHRAWVGRFDDCSHDVHRRLAATYLADERFTAHDDRRHLGLAQYVHDVVPAKAEAVESGR